MLDIPNPPATNRTPYCDIDIESELTTLEGLCVCLREMRFSNAVNTAPPKSGDLHGLLTLIDCVLDQAGKLSTAMRGEGHDDAADGDGEGEGR